MHFLTRNGLHGNYLCTEINSPRLFHVCNVFEGRGNAANAIPCWKFHASLSLLHVLTPVFRPSGFWLYSEQTTKTPSSLLILRDEASCWANNQQHARRVLGGQWLESCVLLPRATAGMKSDLNSASLLLQRRVKGFNHYCKKRLSKPTPFAFPEDVFS